MARVSPRRRLRGRGRYVLSSGPLKLEGDAATVSITVDKTFPFPGTRGSLE